MTHRMDHFDIRFVIIKGIRYKDCIFRIFLKNVGLFLENIFEKMTFFENIFDEMSVCAGSRFSFWFWYKIQYAGKSVISKKITANLVFLVITIYVQKSLIGTSINWTVENLYKSISNCHFYFNNSRIFKVWTEATKESINPSEKLSFFTTFSKKIAHSH